MSGNPTGPTESTGTTFNGQRVADFRIDVSNPGKDPPAPKQVSLLTNIPPHQNSRHSGKANTWISPGLGPSDLRQHSALTHSFSRRQRFGSPTSAARPVREIPQGIPTRYYRQTTESTIGRPNIPPGHGKYKVTPQKKRPPAFSPQSPLLLGRIFERLTRLNGQRPHCMSTGKNDSPGRHRHQRQSRPRKNGPRGLP